MSASVLDRLNPQSAWWPRLLLALAAALVLWLAVRLLFLLLAGPELPPPPPVTLGNTHVGARPSASIAQWHLFGNAAGATAAVPRATLAPETALRLTLRGTLSEQAPDGGIAIIVDEQGVERGYRVGDELPGGARLEAIYAGRVLLSRDGSNESLSLPRLEGGSAPRSGGERGAQAGGAAPPSRIAPFINPMISPAAPQLDTQRMLAGVDVERLAREVSVMPVIENGRVAGVRLSVGRDSDLLARAGLRSSDVVTAVNGIPLDGPQRQQELLSNLQNARQVTLTVRRDGETLQIPVGF